MRANKKNTLYQKERGVDHACQERRTWETTGLPRQSFFASQSENWRPESMVIPGERQSRSEGLPRQGRQKIQAKRKRLPK